MKIVWKKLIKKQWNISKDIQSGLKRFKSVLPPNFSQPSTQMLHQQPQQIFENHHLILDHLDLHHDVEDHVQSSHCPTVYHKKSNISSTSSPEPHYIMTQQFRVIKDSRQYEDGFRVSSSEMDQNHHQMGPPPPSSKSLKIICSEEPTSSTSMPDLGEFLDFFS